MTGRKDIKMASYYVIIRNPKTGEEKRIGEVKAKNQREAKKAVFPIWFGKVDMTTEQIMVVRK